MGCTLAANSLLAGSACVKQKYGWPLNATVRSHFGSMNVEDEMRSLSASSAAVVAAVILTFAGGVAAADSLVPGQSKVRDWSADVANARDKGKFSEALQIANEWTNVEPKNANAWLAQGYILDRMRLDEEAMKSYKRSISLKPDSFIAWHSLGSSHLNMKQYKAASIAFREAVRLKPEDSTARDNLEVALHCIDHCREK